MNISAGFFFFVVYAFAGWLLENGYNWAKGGAFFKENLLSGPFKPMYGFAPVILISLIEAEVHWGIILLACLLVPTIIEYVSGFLLLSVFHRRWWDYSTHRYQLHGHICLSFSLCWFILSLIALSFLHPAFSESYEVVSSVWHWCSPAVAAYMGADLIWSVRQRRQSAVSTSF